MSLSKAASTDHISSARSLGNGKLNVTSSHIPDDLINIVLLRLPVKHLLRCRCVCKPWCYLIDSSNFVKEHFQRNTECCPDSIIVFKFYRRVTEYYSGDVDSLFNFTTVEMAEPLKTFLCANNLVGSCNGLACLYNTNRLGKDNVLLWNPATRKCRKLPRLPEYIPQPCTFFGSSVAGFGYDHLNDDYKVVRTVDSQNDGIIVSVYSLKSNSWTRAETITSRIRLIGKYGVPANGSLYWHAKNDTDNWPSYSQSSFIVAFDLGVEKHRELPFPSDVDESNPDNNILGLVACNRSLCLIDHYDGSHTDIWLMNDDGVENSWTRQFIVEQSGIFSSSDFFWPIAFSSTRNLFLFVVNENKLIWYDPGSNKVEDIPLHGFPVPFDCLVYTESLFQLDHYIKLDRKEKKKQKKQQRNNKRSSLKNDKASVHQETV